MKKRHRNWYFGFISFMGSAFLILVWGWEKPHHIISILILGAFGAFILLSAVLTKMGCIANPSEKKVSEDETIQRNFHSYLDLVTSILYFLGAAISWYMQYENFVYILFTVLIIRSVCIYFFKRFFKDK